MAPPPSGTVSGPDRTHRIDRNETRVTTELNRPSDKTEADRREAVEIVGDALIRVVGRRLVKLHPVIGLIVEPVAQKALGQPAAPADMQYLPQIKRIDRIDDQSRTQES